MGQTLSEGLQNIYQLIQSLKEPSEVGSIIIANFKNILLSKISNFHEIQTK